MKELASAKSDCNTENDFLLAQIRTAVLRAKLSVNELTSVGVALKGGFINVTEAIAWLGDLGLAEMVIPDRAEAA